MKKQVRNIVLSAFFMLQMSLTLVPAFAAEVTGMAVDVPNHQGKYSGENLIDGDPTTAWVGGGKGIGPGKYIEIDFPSPVALESLTIHNGNQGKGQFDKFRRVSKGVILYPDETRQKFTLKPTTGKQTIPLRPVTAGSIKIIITGVAPGSNDKALGGAKVAVSEITIHGTMVEGDGGEGDIGTETVELVLPSDSDAGLDKEGVPSEAVAVIVKEDSKPEAKSDTQSEAVKPKSAPQPTSVPAVKKVEPAAKPTSVDNKKIVKPQPESRVVAPKVTPKKTVSVKPAIKGVQKKSVKQTKPVPSVSQSGATRLRSAVSVPPDKEMDIGVISPWLDLELVAQIKRYFALLTTLHDSYPDVFTSDIRERERKAFLELQAQMRTKKEFGKHHIAMLEHIGLSFDKPTIREDSAMVRAHGPYRYYLENQAFEISVDSLFSFKKENGKWLINGVLDN